MSVDANCETLVFVVFHANIDVVAVSSKPELEKYIVNLCVDDVVSDEAVVASSFSRVFLGRFVISLTLSAAPPFLDRNYLYSCLSNQFSDGLCDVLIIQSPPQCPVYEPYAMVQLPCRCKSGY